MVAYFLSFTEFQIAVLKKLPGGKMAEDNSADKNRMKVIFLRHHYL